MPSRLAGEEAIELLEGVVEKPKPPMGKTDHKIAGSKLVLVVVAHERKREICFGGLFLIETGKALGAFRNLQPLELLGRE